jgi:hypothetical protein
VPDEKLDSERRTRVDGGENVAAALATGHTIEHTWSAMTALSTGSPQSPQRNVSYRPPQT